MGERSDVTLFGVRTVADYFALCERAVAEFRCDQASVLRGFTAILILNHIPDWLQYKLSPEERTALGLANTIGESVRDAFESRECKLGVIRDIANGFKHLRHVKATDAVTGYGRGPYGVGPYGIPYLLVELGDSHDVERWIDCHSLCKRVLEWWDRQLAPISGEPMEGE